MLSRAYGGSDPHESGITEGLTPCIFPVHEGSDPMSGDHMSDINKIGNLNWKPD